MNDPLVFAAHNTVVALVFGLFVYGLTRVWRSPPVAHVLWLLVLLKLVAPPVWHVQWPVRGAHQAALAAGQASVGPESVDVHRPAASGIRTASGIPEAPAAGVRGGGVSVVGRLLPFWDRGRPVLLAIWLAGAVVCGLVAAARIVRFQRLLRDTLPASTRFGRLVGEVAAKVGVARVPEVRYVDCMDVPLVWCAGWRPVIVLPMGLFRQLDDQQAAMILAHELAHVRRRDHWVRTVELVVSLIYWWNPLVPLIRRQIHHAEDLCCDAWVRQAFPEDARRYAEVVFKAAESSSASKLDAHLLLASPFLGSLSLKRRIEMILESRFAPSVSTRAMCIVALLALLILPSFVQTTKAESSRAESSEIAAHQPASGTTAKTAANPVPEQKSPPAPDFPYVVKFQQGVTRFLDGDNITIVDIRGTAERFTPGNIYCIRGTYRLASHERAMLAAFTTATDAVHGRGPYLKVQATTVTRGDGTFKLFLPMSYRGWPHVSFYPAESGEGFGGNYFGTGDSVLKRWWRESKESASRPRAAAQPPTNVTAQTTDRGTAPRHSIFIFGGMGPEGIDLLRKFDPSLADVYGQSHDTARFKEMLKKAQPGDTVLLLLSLETSNRVPEELSDLVLLSWHRIESVLKQGENVFRRGKVRDMNVFLVATPSAEGTRKEFRRLVAEGKFRPDKGATTK